MSYSPSELVYELYGKAYVCAYCYDEADTIDHAVPRWFVEGNIRLITHYRLIKVWACRECNSLAAARVDTTFINRRRRIAKRLRTKYRGLLQTGDWTKEDLGELGPVLRSYCSQSVGAASILLRRLRHLDDPIPPDDIPNELFIGDMSVEEDKPVGPSEADILPSVSTERTIETPWGTVKLESGVPIPYTGSRPDPRQMDFSFTGGWQG